MMQTGRVCECSRRSRWSPARWRPGRTARYSGDKDLQLEFVNALSPVTFYAVGRLYLRRVALSPIQVVWVTRNGVTPATTNQMEPTAGDTELYQGDYDGRGQQTASSMFTAIMSGGVGISGRELSTQLINSLEQANHSFS